MSAARYLESKYVLNPTLLMHTLQSENEIAGISHKEQL